MNPVKTAVFIHLYPLLEGIHRRHVHVLAPEHLALEPVLLGGGLKSLAVTTAVVAFPLASIVGVPVLFCLGAFLWLGTNGYVRVCV